MEKEIVIAGDVKLLSSIEGETEISDTIEGETLPIYNIGGTNDHRRLTHRDSADQHPISAITGLEDRLNEKADSSALATVAFTGDAADLTSIEVLIIDCGTSSEVIT